VIDLAATGQLGMGRRWADPAGRRQFIRHSRDFKI
jgi:hypothetical protein